MTLLKMCGPQIRLYLRFDPLRQNSWIAWLQCYRYSCLTRSCRGNASVLGARGPGFNSRLQQRFLCLMLCFVIVVLLFTSIFNKNCEKRCGWSSLNGIYFNKIKVYMYLAANMWIYYTTITCKWYSRKPNWFLSIDCSMNTLVVFKIHCNY